MAHFALLHFGFNAIVKYAPGSFTIADIINMIALNSMYVIFGVDAIVNKDFRKFIAGNNNFNIIIFMPWILLNITIGVAIFLHKLLRINSFKLATISFSIGVISCLAIILKLIKVKVIF
jgi:hypothetical protein